MCYGCSFHVMYVQSSINSEHKEQKKHDFILEATLVHLHSIKTQKKTIKIAVALHTFLFFKYSTIISLSTKYYIKNVLR